MPTDFVPRDQTSLASAILAYIAADPQISPYLQPTDYAVGSLERSEVEAQALLLEEQDQRFLAAILAAISDSCYNAFGFQKLGPTPSVGGVILSAFVAPIANITIPLGTNFQGPNGVMFATTAVGTLLAGQTTTASIPIQATTPGSAGNVGSGTIIRMITPIAGIDLVTNPTATLGGADGETSDARAIRFAAFLKALPRGTKEALEFAALSASTAVVDARAIEPFLLVPVPPGVPFAGSVWLFVDDGTSSSTLDPGVSAAVSQLVNGYVDGGGNNIPGYKAAGIVVSLYKALHAPVAVRCTVKLGPAGIARWTAIQTALTAAAQDYFSKLRIGDKASYQNLVTVLTNADQDVDEVDLQFWLDGVTLPPAYGSSISGDDLFFYNSAVPLSVGSRGTLLQGTGTGVSTPTTYPEFVLAP